MISTEHIQAPRRKRVIYAWNYVEWGGAQIHILALIKEVRREFDVLVLLPAGSNEQFMGFLDSLGVEYQFFEPYTDLRPAVTLKRKLERHWRKWKSERAMIRRLVETGLHDSIVHVDLAPQQSLLSLMRLCRRTKVFITLHNALPPVPVWRELIWKLKFRMISAFGNFNMFCSNVDSKRYFSRVFPSSFSERIKVTYTSINPPAIDAALAEEFDRPAMLKRFGLPADKSIVLAVGQFIDRKGRWTFLEAAAIVRRDRSDIHFVWLTPVLPNDADQAQITEMGMDDDFTLILSETVGREHQEILEFFRIADVFALPSLVEGLPIALLEAMALGIPSISTNINGIPEAIIDGETGVLIEPGDSAALAQAIFTLVNSEALRQELSKKGRAYVIEHFDERHAARTALTAYKESLVNA